MFSILTVTSEDDDLYKETFLVADVTLEMEVDTGAASSVMSQRTYKDNFSHLSLQKAKFNLKAYNGGQIPVLGHITKNVVYEGKTVDLPLLIVKEYGSTPWQKLATQVKLAAD